MMTGGPFIRHGRSPVSTLLTGVLNLRGLIGEGQPVLPAEEREARRKAAIAEYEADRCPTCGCHPDEHDREYDEEY